MQLSTVIGQFWPIYCLHLTALLLTSYCLTTYILLPYCLHLTALRFCMCHGLYGCDTKTILLADASYAYASYVPWGASLTRSVEIHPELTMLEARRLTLPCRVHLERCY